MGFRCPVALAVPFKAGWHLESWFLLHPPEAGALFQLVFPAQLIQHDPDLLFG